MPEIYVIMAIPLDPSTPVNPAVSSVITEKLCWLETSPPNTGVGGSNPRGLKCDNQKGYVGGWIYPEYSVAWLIPVVGFNSCQYCIYPQGTT